MPSTYTPLRYPGGKSRLAKFLSHLLRSNAISDCDYVEPFAGGAGAAIALLRKEYVRNIHLNDIDKGVYAFWYSVLNHTEQLCERIENAPLHIEEWRRCRDVVKSPEKHSIVDLGFSVLYMNRTNRSGIITGGVIGGQNQDGKWKIDARFNKATLIDKIECISGYRDRISLSCLDAELFLAKIALDVRRKVFVYLDPPYYNKGQALYENHYGHDNHVSLLRALERTGIENWIVSYDNVSQIGSIYHGYPKSFYGLNYSASQRYEGKEVMFYGPGITPPLNGDPLSQKKYA